jgi:Uma2 family endonuclease
MALLIPRSATQKAPWGEYVGIGPLTIEAFDQLPLEEGWKFELWKGDLIRMPGPGDDHMVIMANIYALLQPFLQQHKLGKLRGTGCYNLPLPNSADALLCPDLSYILPGRLATMPKRGSYRIGVPDLVIEIASPNDYRPYMQTKAQTYLQAGVRLVWIIWPNTQIIDVWRSSAPEAPVATLSATDTLDGLDVIPGFTCSVQPIFEMDD